MNKVGLIFIECFLTPMKYRYYSHLTNEETEALPAWPHGGHITNKVVGTEFEPGLTDLKTKNKQKTKTNNNKQQTKTTTKN